ncbi:hypothetical protein LY78DRAFT_223955 [Colletotrichum sublineola]|nr:hypothetical protein LY78DRAFT_223955 [Colletotrichum sublineola]
MDHLPHPQKPFDPIKVPYLEGPSYTPPYETFPARHDCQGMGSYQKHDAKNPLSPATFLQTAQSWSFSGLLQDFLDSAGVVSPHDSNTFLEDFLCDDDGNCLQEPKALAEEWQNDDCLQYTNLGCTQAPKGYWKGVIETSAPRRCVTTKRLWWYLHKAIRNLQEKSPSDRELALKRLENRLYLSKNVALSLDTSFPRTIAHCHGINPQQANMEDQFLAVYLSIQALNQALIQTRLILESKTEGQELIPGSTLLSRRMARQGWCPYQAAWVRNNFTPVSGYFVALLGPHPMPLKCHIECNDRQCRLLQIDENEYQPQHRPSCDKLCNMARPDVDEVCAILEDGGIPLIAIACHSGGTGKAGLSVKVERWKVGVEFYAISHVWSDGMGNPKENALPTCQLGGLVLTALQMRSSQEVSSLQKLLQGGLTVLIWLDTLCVPLTPRARKLAIGRMKDTYSVATKVLVFDATLQQTRLNGASLLERGYRILSCNWQRRLWTLQEAVFAHKLTFRCMDGLLDFEEFPSLLESTESPSKAIRPANFATLELKPALEYFCSGQYRAESISTERINQTARMDRLIGTIDQICHRTTSRISDKAICLATLLDADVHELLKIPEAERFRRVLDHQRGFSPYIIFLNGPKLQEEPYRWAPATFMYPWNAMQRQCFTPPRLKTPDGNSALTRKMGTINASGFYLDLPGIFVCAPNKGVMSGTDFFLWDVDTNGRRVLHMSTVPEDGSDSGGAKPILTFQKDDDDPDTTIVGGSGPRATHGILMMGHFGAPMHGYKDLAPTVLLGLVVSEFEVVDQEIEGKEQRIYKGRSETRVSVVEVQHNRHLIEKHGRAVVDDDGNIKSYDISHMAMACSIRREGLLKWCIR